MDFLTFLSDFGYEQGYVAACELVVARLAPSVRVIHISHGVPPGALLRGAELLARTLPFGPQGVHLAVVDPGVGTARQSLCVVTDRGDYLVGPDNGLLLPAAQELGGIAGAWALVPARVKKMAEMESETSPTFHGRDLFAPAAALLASERPASAMGDPVDPAGLVELQFPPFRREGDTLWTRVSEIDRFGNVQLGADFGEVLLSLSLHLDDGVSVAMHNGTAHKARLVTTFADLMPEELGLLADSWGKATLVCNQTPAVWYLDVEEGDPVALAPAIVSQRSD